VQWLNRALIGGEGRLYGPRVDVLDTQHNLDVNQFGSEWEASRRMFSPVFHWHLPLLPIIRIWDPRLNPNQQIGGCNIAAAAEPV